MIPGKWRWTSGSNQAADAGFGGRIGSFTALAWSEAEKEINPNRRGFLRATANGHALQYADGAPFFLLGDTWLAASTWRLPLRGIAPADNYVPGPGISFEEAVSFRKRQGFNSVSFIAAFPNWTTDNRASTFADRNGIAVRTTIAGLSPGTAYRWAWFDTRKGVQLTPATFVTGRAGNLATPAFPGRAAADWAAKFRRIR